MLYLNLLVALGGFALVVLISALSGRSGRRLWEKCRTMLSCPPTQERITRGKSQSR